MILVTGGTGFVGRRLVHLLAASEQVRVLSRRPEPSLFPRTVEIALGDLSDVPSLVRAAQGARAVVHLAARLPANGATVADIERVNAIGTRALARAARAAGVRQFLHGSSAGVYGDGAGTAPHRESDPPRPGDAYERSKLAGEAALREELAGSDVRWTIVRPAGIYGPGRAATAAFFRQVALRRFWVHGPTRVLVHPTYVEDVVVAVRTILGREDVAGETFNIGGERPLDYVELIALVAARMGHQLRQVRMPGVTRQLAVGLAGLLRAVGRGAAPRLTRLALPAISRAVDTGKAREILGFTPVPLERGLDETAAWVRAGGVA